MSMELRVVSLNVRYATSSLAPGELPWAKRLPLIVAQLRFIARAQSNVFICLQEVLHNQLVDILGCLRSWSHIGVGRDDGKQKGEYSPVLYQPNRWRCISAHTTWLSKTQDRPSKGWDASSIRIVTAGVFEQVEDSRQIGILSTHLDDQGAESRFHAAGILLEILRASPFNEMPVILAGDFNARTDDRAYRRMVESGIVRDCKDLAAFKYGEQYTYTGFDKSESPARIDFLFLSVPGRSPEAEISVAGHSILQNKNQDEGAYFSDHRPVIGDFDWKGHVTVQQPSSH